MAVHHFTAPDLTVARGWQPMETFPHDGSVVEVRDETNHIVRAIWLVKTREMIVSGGLAGAPVQWRHPEE
jgi:hypothetical protein